MPRKAVEELGEGMITEEPVLDELGNVVLREGIELTGRLIDGLKNRRVASVSVAGAQGSEESGMTEEEKMAMRRQAEEKVQRMFAGHKNPLMAELAEATKRFVRGKIR